MSAGDVGEAVGLGVIATLYEHRKDIFEALSPLCERALLDLLESSGRTQFALDEVRDRMGSLFGVNFPLATCRTLVRRLKKNRKLQVLSGGETVEVMPEELQRARDAYDDVQREVNELADDLAHFCTLRGMTLSREAALVAICNLLWLNKASVSAFFGARRRDESSRRSRGPEQPTQVGQVVVEYFRHIRAARKAMYAVLKKLYFGSMLASLVESTEASTVTGKPRMATLLLDSNFVLRVLDYETELQHEAAMELVRRALAAGFSLAAMDSTVNEVKGVFGRFLILLDSLEVSPSFRALPAEALEGLPGAFKRRGLKRADVLRMRNTLEQELSKECGVRVLEAPAEFSPVAEELFEQLKALKAKPEFERESAVFAQAVTHDVAAICYVGRARGGPVYRYQDATHWFLTCDHRLAYFNQVQMGRKHPEQIAEVITEVQLTNLLWLASPDASADAGIANLLATLGGKAVIEAALLRDFDRFTQGYLDEHPREEERVALLYSATDLAGEIRPVFRDLPEADEEARALVYERINTAIEKQEALAADSEERHEELQRHLLAVEAKLALQAEEGRAQVGRASSAERKLDEQLHVSAALRELIVCTLVAAIGLVVFVVFGSRVVRMGVAIAIICGFFVWFKVTEPRPVKLSVTYRRVFIALVEALGFALAILGYLAD